jgi:glycolate oxidase FAD binding subunit
VPDGDAFWSSVREQSLPSFQGTLWRLSLKSTTPPLGLPGRQVIEWNGALRWVATDAPRAQVVGTAQRAGAQAVLFRGGDRSDGIFELEPKLLAIHQRLKAALDPHGIFGPGRLHPDF